MRTIYESILGSTKTGISGVYEVGKRLVVDDVPCTVIYNHSNTVILLSDTFCGTQGNKPVFRKNEEIDKSNFAMFCFARQNAQAQRKYVPKGWNIPLCEWFHFEEVQNALKTYILPTVKSEVSRKFWTREKSKSSYRYFACDARCSAGQPINYSMYYEEIGVRFAKMIKL